MPAAFPCRLPTFGAGVAGEVIGAPAAAVSSRLVGAVGIVTAGSPPGTAGGAAGARTICEPAAGTAGAAIPSAARAGDGTGVAGCSAARVAPARDEVLAGSASRSGDGVESRSTGSGGTWTATASARTPSATPAPGSDIVSGAAGSGEPKIHAASAHNTKLRARTRIPESRVMALPFVAGSDDAGHDSPIAGRCAGRSQRRSRRHPPPRTGFASRIVRSPPSPSGVRLPPSPARHGQRRWRVRPFQRATVQLVPFGTTSQPGASGSSSIICAGKPGARIDRPVASSRRRMMLGDHSRGP